MAVRLPPGQDPATLHVTCFALPIVGHMTPLLPVLRQLVARGATVEVVTGAASAPRFTAVGATVMAFYPEAFTEAVQRPSDNFIEVAALLATWTEQTLLTQARRVLAETRPDVVVVDSMAPWGRLAAEECGIPVVTSTSSFLIDARLGASPRAAVDIVRRTGSAAGSLLTILRIRRRLRARTPVDLGGPVRLLSNRGATTLVYTSRELQPASERFGDDVHFVGPTAVDREGPAVDPASALAQMLIPPADGRPLAHVSLGTIYNDRPRFLRHAALALVDEGYRVTVDLGAVTDAASLGDLPAHVLCVRDPPQLAVLDRAALFVTHGGMNSVHEALWRSIPMVVFPQAADQPLVAARLAEFRAASVVRGRDPGVAEIAKAVRAVRSGRGRVAAAMLGDGLRLGGGAPAAAQVILDVAAAGRG